MVRAAPTTLHTTGIDTSHSTRFTALGNVMNSVLCGTKLKVKARYSFSETIHHENKDIRVLYN